MISNLKQKKQLYDIMVSFTIPQEIERFYELTEKSDLEKKILDCGAGGSEPTIAVFSERGYKTHGVEISDTQIERAQKYAEENNLDFKIIKADIRELPYEDESFSFVYSYNSIEHLTKAGTKIAVKEMLRVLKKGGLLYINFQSTDSAFKNQGKDIGDNEVLDISHAGKHGFEDTFHSFYDFDEVDELFTGLKLLHKGKTIFDFTYNDEKCQSITIDYIMQKE
ncbi:MAG TPA: class I SAM-dependent methyltransferase [Candidatus Bathyarchaeia archaeon]|nr:class I SAM-dependent methyltransferase [Candidatus Bathyarchaeia archaeon]